jgi:hypothetical protein
MATKLEQSLMDNYLNATYPALPKEQEQPPAEMKEYDPTMREQAAEKLQAILEGLGVERYKARQNAQSFLGGASSNMPLNLGLVDYLTMIPGINTAVGTAMLPVYTEESMRSLEASKASAEAGNLGKAGIEAVGGSLGMIPAVAGATNITKKIVKKAGMGNK